MNRDHLLPPLGEDGINQVPVTVTRFASLELHALPDTGLVTDGVGAIRNVRIQGNVPTHSTTWPSSDDKAALNSAPASDDRHRGLARIHAAHLHAATPSIARNLAPAVTR